MRNLEKGYLVNKMKYTKTVVIVEDDLNWEAVGFCCPEMENMFEDEIVNIRPVGDGHNIFFDRGFDTDGFAQGDIMLICCPSCGKPTYVFERDEQKC